MQFVMLVSTFLPLSPPRAHGTDIEWQAWCLILTDLLRTLGEAGCELFFMAAYPLGAPSPAQ